MEISYLIIGFFVGGILGAAIVYFVLKSSSVARNLYDELNNNLSKSIPIFRILNQKLMSLTGSYKKKNIIMLSNLMFLIS
jgi:DNA recombination protein RmuC